MRVYVAGRTSMIPEVRHVMGLVENFGHEITYDWTANVEAEGGAASEIHVPPDRQIVYAHNDRWGVLTSDVTIVVTGPNLTGTLVECGIALAFCGEIQVILYGSPERESVFFELPEVKRITTQFDLMAELENLAHIKRSEEVDPALRLQRLISPLRPGGLRGDREQRADPTVAGRHSQSS